MKTQIEITIEIEVDFNYDPGQIEIINALPEYCQQRIPPSIDINSLTFLNNSEEIDISNLLESNLITNNIEKDIICILHKLLDEQYYE